MPLPRQEVDATTPKYLRDKYAIVGVGEATYTRGSNKTTRALGSWAGRVAGDMLQNRAYGWQSAGKNFAPSFMRDMHDYGTKPEQVAAVKVAHSHHASNNPKAYYKKRFTVDDVLSSRIISKPLHLLDCCVETDNATAIIVTSAERAKDCKHPLVLIRGVVGRCNKPRLRMHYQHGPISTVAGHYAKEILWPNAGVGPEDVDITGSYGHCP